MLVVLDLRLVPSGDVGAGNGGGFGNAMFGRTGLWFVNGLKVGTKEDAFVNGRRFSGTVLDRERSTRFVFLVSLQGCLMMDRYDNLNDV